MMEDSQQVPEYGNPAENNVINEEMDEASYAAKIFVGGISWQTTREMLRTHFEKYGYVVDVAIMSDKPTRQPRCVLVH